MLIRCTATRPKGMKEERRNERHQVKPRLGRHNLPHPPLIHPLQAPNYPYPYPHTHTHPHSYAIQSQIDSIKRRRHPSPALAGLTWSTMTELSF